MRSKQRQTLNICRVATQPSFWTKSLCHCDTRCTSQDSDKTALRRGGQFYCCFVADSFMHLGTENCGNKIVHITGLLRWNLARDPAQFKQPRTKSDDQRRLRRPDQRHHWPRHAQNNQVNQTRHVGLDRYRAGARYPILSAAAVPILEMTSSIAWGKHMLHTPYIRFKT